MTPTTTPQVSVLREALDDCMAALEWPHGHDKFPGRRAQLDAYNAAVRALFETERADIQPAGERGYLEPIKLAASDTAGLWLDEYGTYYQPIPSPVQEAKAEQGECLGMLTVCPTCKNDIAKCVFQPSASEAKREASELPSDSDCLVCGGSYRHKEGCAYIDARQPVAAPSDDAYRTQYEMLGRIAAKDAALVIAEAALSDIGDADREPGDDLAWCERRAAQALPVVRAAMPRHSRTPPGKSAAPVAPTEKQAYELAAQACDQQGDGTNGPYRNACLQCADACRVLRDAAPVAQGEVLTGPIMGYVNLETLDCAAGFYQNKIPDGYLPFYLAPADIDAIKIDADRYRWIRIADYEKLDAIKDKRWKGLDEAIDAAILAKRTGSTL